MPEASDLLARSFPMRVREINDLSPLQENEEYKGDHQEMVKKTEAVGDGISKSVRKSSDSEADGTEDTIEDDYGFFPMDDDDDDFQCGEEENQNSALQEDAASSSNSDASSEQLGSSYGSSMGRRRNRMKSALKRGSAYGDGHEGIPLDFERKEFNRVLPKPDLSQRSSLATSQPSKAFIRSGSRGLFRVSSEPVFVRPVYQPDDSDDPLPTDVDKSAHSVPSGGFVEGAMKKRISFGTIAIREHVQTIGDNPSCSYGTPVQLDWGHEDMEEIEVDEYEIYRTKPRSKDEFYLNHFQRINLLKLNGYSTNEIKDSKRRVSKSRNQRELTKFLVTNYPQLVTVEDVIESGVRKVKRSISKSKLKSNGDSESIPRNTSKDDLSLKSRMSKEKLLEMMDNDESNVTAPF